MALAQTTNGDLLVLGNLTFTGSLGSSLARTNLAIESQSVYPVPWTFMRKYAAFDTNLPGTSSGSDLALVGGTFGTNTPSIQTSDLHAAGATTRYARFNFQLPPEYVAGAGVSVRVHAGMLNNAADTTATVNVETYKSDRERGLGSNLSTGGAVTINSTTLADKTFTVTSTSLSPGDTLDIRITIAVNDAAGASSVIACIGEVAMLLNIRG